MIPVLIADNSAKIIYVSEAFCQLIDSDGQSLIGEPLYPYIDPLNLGVYRNVLIKGTREDPIYHSAIFELPVKGSYEITFKVYPVKDSNLNKTLLHVSIAVDTKFIKPKVNLDIEDDEFKKLYKHSSLGMQDAKDLYQEVQNIMLTEHIFLDANLSLESVSRRIGTNQLYLSQSVNFFKGYGFREYLNHHRINYLRTKYSLEKSPKVSELWSIAGFGSYSAFRRFLKIQLELSPSEFSKELRTLFMNNKY